MKKILFVVCLMASSVISATAAPDREYAISFEQLPAAVQTFVNTHFSGIQVAYCLRDGRSYEVRLTDASEIEFNLSGSWKEIDCKHRVLPASVLELVPAAIPEYVKATFPTALITKISTKFRGYEVELDNGLDLDFSSAGKFRRIDD